MINLGTIQVRILEAALPHGGAPSSYILESQTPGIKAEYIPKRIVNEDETYWDLEIPITEFNIDYCVNTFFLHTGYLVKMNRLEIPNPFNQSKQKRWFEEELLKQEAMNQVVEPSPEEIEFQEKYKLAIQELKAFSLEYHEKKASATEYGWPLPVKKPEQIELEKNLQGYVDKYGNFIEVSEEEIEDMHDVDAKIPEPETEGSF